MPTGYTNRLENLGYDVNRWLKESVPRALGVLQTLRDENPDLTQAEIESKLKAEAQSDVGFYQRKLKEVRDKQRIARALSPEEWAQRLRDSQAESEATYTERMRIYNYGRESHVKAMQEIDRLTRIAVETKAGDVVMGALRFAKEQLGIAFEHDYKYPPDAPDDRDTTVEAYRDSVLRSWDRAVDYHATALERAIARQDERRQGYSQLVKFLDANATKVQP